MDNDLVEEVNMMKNHNKKTHESRDMRSKGIHFKKNSYILLKKKM